LSLTGQDSFRTIIIDVEIAEAEFEGRNVKGFMPVLGCPNCNRETMEFAVD